MRVSQGGQNVSKCMIEHFRRTEITLFPRIFRYWNFLKLKLKIIQFCYT